MKKILVAHIHHDGVVEYKHDYKQSRSWYNIRYDCPTAEFAIIYQQSSKHHRCVDAPYLSVRMSDLFDQQATTYLASGSPGFLSEPKHTKHETLDAAIMATLLKL